MRLEPRRFDGWQENPDGVPTIVTIGQVSAYRTEAAQEGQCMSEGFVYILSSPNSPHVKIGGTEHPPAVRLKGVNSDAAYQDHGPWIVSDFLHVTDWREVERLLHTLNVGQQVRDIAGTRELFSIGIATARAQLADINPALIVRRLELDRLFQLKPLALYLERMFRSAGLAAWIHTQGTWTLRLFPSTSGGRYFTLNIGAHETAYCTLPRGDAALPIHGLGPVVS